MDSMKSNMELQRICRAPGTERRLQQIRGKLGITGLTAATSASQAKVAVSFLPEIWSILGFLGLEFVGLEVYQLTSILDARQPSKRIVNGG